jgi:FkbM family methyltransferase
MMRLGGSYGGWTVPRSLLSAESICYCVGVGDDIRFDLGLIDMVGCDVFAFDPTPSSVEFVGRTASNNAKYHFQPVGLWHENSRQRFYAPRNVAHRSYSIVNLQRTEQFFEAECRTLSTLMHGLGHSHLDLLKIDIEGAEYAVLDNILRENIKPRILCVEFDQPMPYRKTLAMIRRLSAEGYALVHRFSFDFTFVFHSSL